jgi:mRNA-degrading endonuclease toxin of MazEF toxin-antitoxin module
MPNEPSRPLPTPRRGEIWTAYLGESRQRHWVLVVSPNQRNLSDKAYTVLVVPFASRLVETSTTLVLQEGETGLPGPSCLRGHFITTLFKDRLIERQPRTLSETRLRQVCAIIRRSYDPDAPL